MELHHGGVTCESAGLNLGSKFIVCLPKLPAHALTESSELDQDADQAAVSLRVMIVDDNVDAAALQAMFLETLGHQVFVEHSSRDALRLAKNQPPDVCLLDIGLPEMDGYELARRLRQQPETASARLIAITEYGQESDRLQALAAGFDVHLVKPSMGRD